MAQGFSRRGRGKNVRYAATLDPDERAVVASLLGQVLELIDAPAARPSAAETDSFEAIVAGLGADFGTAPAETAPPEPLGGRGFGAEQRDPALDRLFPAGNRTDEHAATEFRRLTEDSLRRRKADNLTAAITMLEGEDGDKVELTPAQAQTFLVALTDVRLVLGERLGLRDDDDAFKLEQAAQGLDPEDPAGYAIALYDFCTWLQETLATSLLSGQRR